MTFCHTFFVGCSGSMIFAPYITRTVKTMAYKKIDKEFCLTDDSVNAYRYRLLTSGLMLERFSPAIGMLMHNREKGVAVKWEDFRIEGDKLFAKPVVNITQFPDLADQIEEGFYSGASVGHIVALELSDDPDLKLEGQTGPTVTKWFPRECSIVDIPGNYNALAHLYDESNKILHDLAANPDFSINHHKEQMEKIIVTAAVLSALNLSADASADQFGAELNNLVAKAAKVDGLEKELNDLKATQAKERVTTILNAGKAEGKLTNLLAEELEKNYAAKPDELKSLVDKMPVQARVTGGGADAGVPDKYKGKTFNDLYVSGELAALKSEFPDYYETLKNKR